MSEIAQFKNTLVGGVTAAVSWFYSIAITASMAMEKRIIKDYQLPSTTKYYYVMWQCNTQQPYYYTTAGKDGQLTALWLQLRRFMENRIRLVTDVLSDKK